MFGKRPVAEVVVGSELSVDLTNLWAVSADVYAVLHPGPAMAPSRQRIALVDGDCRRMVWERVHDGQRELLPEGVDESLASYWDCTEDEMPFVACTHAGSMVWLPQEVCEGCGVAEGSTLLAEDGAHGTLWLYPQRTGGVICSEGTS